MSNTASVDAFHAAHSFSDFYSQTKNLSSISREIALMRAIVESKLKEMEESGSDPNEGLHAIAPALQTIARLVKTETEISERANESLRKDALAELAKVLIAAVSDEVLDLPEGPERLERIAKRFQDALQQCVNT